LLQGEQKEFMSPKQVGIHSIDTLPKLHLKYAIKYSGTV
jgi:hypothetical protein